jgi:hypothetical protein
VWRLGLEGCFHFLPGRNLPGRAAGSETFLISMSVYGRAFPHCLVKGKTMKAKSAMFFETNTDGYPMKKLSITAALAVATIFSAFSVQAGNFVYMSVNGGDFGTVDLNNV